MATDVRTAQITITALDPADPAAVEGAYQVQRRSRAHDVPDFPSTCRHRFEAQMHVPWPGERLERWIARDGDEIVGHLEVGLPTFDNLQNAFVEPVVLPEHRRRGIGRALFDHGVSYAKTEGRTRIMAFTPVGLPGGVPRDPAGSAFAEAMGMSNALEDLRRRLDVATIDHAALDALLAEAWARAEGYSLVRWTSRVPDDCVEDVARLDSDFVNEVPMGDLAWEPEKVDVQRVRASEAARQRYGSRNFSTAARDANGRVVAWSALSQEYSHEDHAWQGITLVHPEHRGHRLGTIVKIENLRFALGNLPRLRYIDTWNAAVNRHMIAINELMGFRVVEAWRNWQRDI